MALQITFRNGTPSQWSSTNPTLSQGEVGTSIDAPSTFKIGDGSTAWNSLAIAPTASPTQTIPWASLGDGGDGNLTISSGTTTLVRDMFYNNLTINGTGSIYTNGYRIFVKGILDLSNAPIGAINFNGGNGGNASGSVAGTSTSGVPNGSIGGSLAGGAGGAGSTGVGTAGGASVAGYNGGVSNSSGAGGTNGTNAGAAAAAGAGSTAVLRVRRWAVNFLRGVTLVLSGSSGRGAGSGGGDGTNLSGAGGAGGNGGGTVAIYANIVVRSASTASGAIQANGGNGGNGGNGSVGVVGGGGGGSGGGGGWVYLAYNYLMGPQVTNFITTDGGMGGSGGNGFGTINPVLSGGSGGLGGYGGRITLFDIHTQTGLEYLGENTVQENPEVTLGNTAITPFGSSGGMGGDPGLSRLTI